MIAGIASIVVLVAASSLFVAAEFSLIAARRSLIEPMAAGSTRARATLAAMDNVSTLLACAQLGITVCGLVLGAVGEPALALVIEPLLHRLGVPEAASATIGLVIALAIVVGVHVAFGEMVPKNIALAAPERTAMVLVPLLRVVTGLFGPLVKALDHLANGIVRLTGVTPGSEAASTYTSSEVADFVAQSAREGLIDPEDEQLVDAALDFERVPVTTVVIPPADLVTVGPAPTAADVEAACVRSGFSRFPVRAPGGASSVYAGYVHVRDVLSLSAADAAEPLPAQLVRALPEVTVGAGLRSAIETMQRQRAHMCQVTGPDGAVGVVMLEDALEILIGEVVDATRRTA